MKKHYYVIALIAIFNLITTTIFAQCNAIYVTTTGLSTGAGTQADPQDIVTAFSTSLSGTTIKIATGTYTINNPLVLASSGVVVEGGFQAAAAWTKTSQAGATTILRSNVNLEGTIGSQRLVAIYINGKSNFRFQDITISTSATTSAGASTYCVHLTSCSTYEFTRTQILPGNASAGQNGVAGVIGGVGSNGFGGLGGAIDDTGFSGPGGNGGAGNGVGAGTGGTGGGSGTGSNGSPGVTSSSIRAGGGGGGGASGGSGSNNGKIGGNGGGVNAGAIQTPGGTGGNWGDPGGAGGNGTTGALGANGLNGASGLAGSHVSGYFVPGSQGTSGSDGYGGKGGTGGGGGGGQSCLFCIDGSGDGGGGGGGGGQGATGGTGGTGGGGSFGVYLYTNGVGGTINDSWVVAGASGTGGTGATGGIGGNGGNGGNGSIYGTSEVGRGGNGGAGGKGGNGGNGGSGSNGVSVNVYLASGSALTASTTNFNLSIQPIINASEVFCTNQSIQYGALTSSNWDFGATSSPQTITGQIVSTTYTSTGIMDVIYSGNSYKGFVTITCTSPDLPTISASSSAICPGSSVTLSVTSGNLNSSTNWEWYEGSCGGTIVGSGTSVSVSPTLTNTTYYARASGGCPIPGSCVSLAIVMEDVTDPVLDILDLGDITDQCSISSLTSPTATDNCAGEIAGVHNATLPITAQGTTIVTWTYTDPSGNTATQVQNVVIDDNTAPEPLILLDIQAQCEVTSLVDPAVTDNCSGPVTITNDAVLPITSQGSTVVTWTYVDVNGNVSSQTQNILISDYTVPVASLTSLQDVLGDCEVTSLPIATATDNCDGTISGTNNAVFPITQIGTTVITWTYTDAAGNITTQNQNVVITCTNGISENNLESGITVFPNPNNGTFTVISSEEGTFNLVNELGQIIQPIKVLAGIETEVKVEGLSNGVYFLTGVSNNGTLFKRIVVKK